jgi:integrase
VPGLRFHDLRRSAIRNLIRTGTPQSVAMKISGHRTVSTFLRYDIVSDEDMRAALRAVADHVSKSDTSNVVAIKPGENPEKVGSGPVTTGA